ncbi:hypothetical protein TSUD_01620 [Trifolium subterraneum]|nr:hypothetical protein TSUD_01620 [Trifolium subterraneum]
MTTASPNNSVQAPRHIPFDLAEDILFRLPVKQLLQLSCVCKSWNSLISHDSKFAKKHLRFSIFSHHLSLLSSREFRLWKSPISSFFSSEAAASTDSFSHPLIKHIKAYEVVSTCDGILCFRIDGSLALLCNPSIRKFNLLPPLINPYFEPAYTLVYDRFIDNYKIIALSSCCHDKNKRQVHVHTLGTKYWRKIQDFPNHYSCRVGQGIFVSDRVNWLVSDTHNGLSTAIVTLDLEKESYQELLHPPDDELSFPINCLGALRDWLCIFSHSRKFCDIWVMKKYGNEDSWTKLLRVPYIGETYFCSLIQPLYIDEDNRMLMRIVNTRNSSLAVYDSKNNKTHDIQNDIPTWAVPKVYVESLISPFRQ